MTGELTPVHDFLCFRHCRLGGCRLLLAALGALSLHVGVTTLEATLLLSGRYSTTLAVEA